MSRCLTFPPPGFVWNGVSGEALFELIKVGRERVKAEREKEKKRRKKEKKKKRREQILQKKKRGYHRNKGNEGRNENQWLERSSLNDELEQPVSDSLYESSDNTQSILRKRIRTFRCCKNHGSLIQIPESPSSKPDCPSCLVMDSAFRNKLELCLEEKLFSDYGLPAATDVQELVPTPLRHHDSDKISEMDRFEWMKPPKSNILETSVASKDVLDHGIGNSTSCLYDLLNSPAMINSTIQKTLGRLHPKPVQEQTSSASGVPATTETNYLMETESRYRELVENWVFPSLQSDQFFEIGDQEWLFETKQPISDRRDTSIIAGTYDHVLDQAGNFTDQYPHAQYLAEVKIYALPYTLPY